MRTTRPETQRIHFVLVREKINSQALLRPPTGCSTGRQSDGSHITQGDNFSTHEQQPPPSYPCESADLGAPRVCTYDNSSDPDWSPRLFHRDQILVQFQNFATTHTDGTHHHL